MKTINTPLENEVIASLKAGDELLLTGEIYTARDQAHLRLSNMMQEGKDMPIKMEGQIIYYCGPTPPGNRIIGACGPTTSSRMDLFTPTLLDKGLKGMIGKGSRSKEVVGCIKKVKAIYFLAPGGAGAYLSDKVKSCELIAFEDLGPEAMYKLQVKDFPLIVGVDSSGESIFE